MVAPWITFVKIAVDDEDLANFIDIPLWNGNNDAEPPIHYQPHRLLKIEDDDIVTYLRAQKLVPASGVASMEKRKDAVDYTFPNKTVKFFVIIEMSATAVRYKVRTSVTADTADGVVREDISVATQGNSLYTTEVIEGNFNGNFLTIENVDATGFFVQAAVIIEPA